VNRSKRLRLHRAASREIVEAAIFYAQCSQGGGGRFLDATESVILKIRESPGRFRQIEQNLYQRNDNIVPTSISVVIASKGAP
jgi:hypothetical protein